MLTARGTEADRIVGLELGADDYVVKPFSGAEVIARIRAILRRSAAQPADDEPPPGPIAVGELEVDIGARRARLNDDELQLSRKEFDLLAELIRNAGRVVTREQLMDRVWDENWFGSTKTLDVHVRWLRQKLGDDPADPRFLHTVRGVGFRFTAPEELRKPPPPSAAGARLRAGARGRRPRGPAHHQHPRPRRRRGQVAGAEPGRDHRGDARRAATARRSRR